MAQWVKAPMKTDVVTSTCNPSIPKVRADRELPEASQAAQPGVHTTAQCSSRYKGPAPERWKVRTNSQKLSSESHKCVLSSADMHTKYITMNKEENSLLK